MCIIINFHHYRTDTVHTHNIILKTKEVCFCYPTAGPVVLTFVLEAPNTQYAVVNTNRLCTNVPVQILSSQLISDKIFGLNMAFKNTTYGYSPSFTSFPADNRLRLWWFDGVGRPSSEWLQLLVTRSSSLKLITNSTSAVAMNERQNKFILSLSST